MYLRVAPLLSFLIRFLPRKPLMGIAILFGDFLYFSSKRRRRILEKNMVMILGNIRKGELRKRVRDSFRYTSLKALDFLDIPNLGREEMMRMVEIEGEENIEKIKGRPSIIVSAHLGNWDLGSVVLSQTGIEGAIVVERLPDWAYEIYKKYRKWANLAMIPLTSSPFGMVRVLREGKSLVLAADRDLTNTGRVTDFLRGKRKMPEGPAYWAFRMKVPVLTAFFVRKSLRLEREKSYLAVAETPIDPDNYKSFEEIFDEIKRRIERAIRKFPEQWFVYDPRWIEE